MDINNESNQFAILVCDKNDRTLFEISGQKQASLIFARVYQEGDKIKFRKPPAIHHLLIQVDEILGGTYVYAPCEGLEYMIPYGEETNAYSPEAFKGEKHSIKLCALEKEEMGNSRNLALNNLDTRGNATFYPHATSNNETRGESVFAARNVIDGLRDNTDHGFWPYTSWGPDINVAAEFLLEFGRIVEVEKVVFYIRADFPHDSFWKFITIEFSNGTEEIVELQKTGESQVILFKNIKTEWVKLKNLKKADEPAEFPALTQIEVYGKDF